VYPRLGRATGQFVQRCSHPGVVRPPEDAMPSPGFFVLSVPWVGEEVLTIHAWYLRVVAVGAQRPEPALRASAHCAGNARLLAAPNRYLAADPRQDHACSKSADDVSAEPERCRIEVQALVPGPTRLCETVRNRPETSNA